MTRLEFLAALRERLCGLPEEDISRICDYYSEIIDDRVEDGTDEQEAVAALGTVEEIVAEVLGETPLPRLIKERVRPRRELRGWEIALIVVGSPLWVSLLIAAAAIVLSVYIVLWAVVISLYSIVAALGVCAVAGAVGLVFPAARDGAAAGLVSAGGGLICAGLAILALLGCNRAAKGIALLGRKLLLAIKFSFVRRGSEK